MIDPRLHLLQRVNHVCVVGERNADFCPAADRARANAYHSRHDAHCLFNRARDAKQHLPRTEGRSLSHHENARKREFWVDGGRKAQGRVNPTGAEQSDEQVDESSLRGQEVEERSHYFAWTTLTLSSNPYAPSVTTCSPSARPERISALVSLRRPTVTLRSRAMLPGVTTNTL